LDEDGGASFPSSAEAETGPGATPAAADLPPKLLPPSHSSVVACIHLFPSSPHPRRSDINRYFTSLPSVFIFIFIFILFFYALLLSSSMISPETINAGTEAQTSPERRINPLDLRLAPNSAAVTGHCNTALFPDGTKPHRPLPIERSFFTRWRVIICWPKDDVLTSSSIIVYTFGFFHLVFINFTAFFFLF
jgi:hypothetical protein